MLSGVSCSATTTTTSTATMNNILGSLSGLSLREPPLGKIEILQDLDLYYIKQLAHNFKVSRRKDRSPALSPARTPTQHGVLVLHTNHILIYTSMIILMSEALWIVYSMAGDGGWDV